MKVDGTRKFLGTSPYSESEKFQEIQIHGFIRFMSRMRIILSGSRALRLKTGSTSSPISDSNINYQIFFLMIDLILETKPNCPEFYFCDFPLDPVPS